MALIELFHAGFQEIRNVDIRIGRTNADFGQGFYLSPDEGFCRRWAREKKGQNAWINGYTLCTEGLNIKEFRRDGEWYDYIFRNRAGYPDSLSEYDVIMGPIANDTIYNLWGVTTSATNREYMKESYISESTSEKGSCTISGSLCHLSSTQPTRSGFMSRYLHSLIYRSSVSSSEETLFSYISHEINILRFFSLYAAVVCVYNQYG